MIITKLEAAGRLAAFLEMRKQLNVKKLHQQLNPSNSPNGFLIKGADLMKLSNILHEKIANCSEAKLFMSNTKIESPLFTIDDITEFDKDNSRRQKAVMAFYEGLYKPVTKYINIDG